MTDASVNDPCECGQTTIRGCAEMPSRHCGAWEQTTPPAFTAHELSALAEQEMTLTEAEEATVRDARGQAARIKSANEAISNECIRLVEENARLRTDNARLREALAPFRDVAVVYDGTRAKCGLPLRSDEYAPQTPKFTMAAFRRARTAMEASNGNQ
jgi:hypothetical protein